VPHITLTSIANNAEIDAIHETAQRTLEPLRAEINRLCGKNWEEWEMPRVNPAAEKLLAQWWAERRARQTEIDGSIARNAETEYLYDRPQEDRTIVAGERAVHGRELVAAPRAADRRGGRGLAQCARHDDGEDDFVRVVLENLKVSGVQNTKKGERLAFTGLKPWAGGKYIHAEGRYEESSRRDRESSGGRRSASGRNTARSAISWCATRRGRRATCSTCWSCAASPSSRM